MPFLIVQQFQFLQEFKNIITSYFSHYIMLLLHHLDQPATDQLKIILISIECVSL